MPLNTVIYSASQQDFFEDVNLNQVSEKMLENARQLNIKPGLSEISSWSNNAPRIKSLLELAKVQNSYVTFEYVIPYNRKRIDCMIYGKGKDGKGNVVHLELKQWCNEGVSPAESAGNFDVDESSDEDVVYRVNAVTGGGVRLVAHPSQQVRGYNDYLTGFVEVLSERELNLTGAAYCYNYKRYNSNKTALYDSRYDQLLNQYRTYAGDEVKELASLLGEVLGNGDGLSIFNKMMNSPIRPSQKLLDSAAELVHKGNAAAFSLIEDQIVARNIILDKIRNFHKLNKKSVILVKGGPGTGKTVIALHLLALIAGMKDFRCNVHYATKSKPLLEGVKFQLPRGSKAKMLFHNVTQYVPANCDENGIDVLMVDEAHRITKSSNNQYTPAEKRTDMSQCETLIRAAKVSVFFIDDKQAIRGVEIGSTSLIRHYAKQYGAKIEEVELKSQFRCNGSDNYLDWLEQILYNYPRATLFDKDEFDFRVFDSPNKLYSAIKEKDSASNTTARLCAGFCWPWSSNLGPDGDLVKDVRIGDFAMPWETKDTIKNVPAGYVKWYEWAYKPEGIKQVGCIYTAQGFEFDYVGVIVGPDIYFDKTDGLVKTRISESKDPVLKRSGEGIDGYIRNIYRVLMSRGMKGCYVYICDESLREYVEQSLKIVHESGYKVNVPIMMAADNKTIYKA